MIKTEKVGDDFILTIRCKHTIIDDCFTYNNLNSASEGKRLIMELAGEAYEKYVRELSTPEDLEYLNKEFKSKSCNLTI